MTTDLLLQTETALQTKLTKLLADLEKENAPPDKVARAVSSLLKTLDELAARRERIEAETAQKRHTRYEDMPPPTPEDEARFYERFKLLVGLVDDVVADQSALAFARTLRQASPD